MSQTAYGDISPRTAAYAEKELLKRGLPYLVLEKFGQAKTLRSTVEHYQKDVKGAASLKPLSGFDGFQKKIGALSDLDLQGNQVLAARGTDGDLKCILRGISQDLPKKLDELMKASDAATQAVALRDMYYLLNDNVEVITAPPQPEV